MLGKLIKMLMFGAALYGAGKIGYELGKEDQEETNAVSHNEPIIAELEPEAKQENESVHDETVESEEKPKGIVGRWMARHSINNLVNVIKHPERHKMEVTMDGEDTIVRIKKRDKNSRFNE